MDSAPFYSTLLSSNVIPQAPTWPIDEGLDNSRRDCLPAHTSQGEVRSPIASEDSRLQCTLSMSGDGRPALYSGLEVLRSYHPHLLNHSTFFPESGQTDGIRIYSGPSTQSCSLVQFIDTGLLRDRWDMQGHAGDVFCSDGREDVSKCARLPLAPWLAAQARMEPYYSGLDAQQSSVAQLTSVDDRGMTAPTTWPLSALHPCGWVKEDGTRCNIHITYDCAGHLATAHNIRQQGRRLKVLCCWCDLPRPIRRSSMLRHVREVHLKCPRSSTRA
ncbi:hypothetical protein EV401DRAFT_1294503 [Pisolithus croceorrhizus]|nr:hypothetical protein EV401DRAFT_1294503 [Pisolithus croceorrhizus]